MPEFPDVEIYLERLAALVQDQPIERIELRSPFVLRSVSPPIGDAEGRRVVSFRRLGKRLVLGLEGNLFLVIHLMIAGRLRWRPPGKKMGGKLVLAAFTFPHGTLFLTEAGTSRRASIHLVTEEAGLAPFERGGLEVFEIDLLAFAERLREQRDELLRPLPNRRPAARRPRDVAATQTGLAPVARRDRMTPASTRD